MSQRDNLEAVMVLSTLPDTEHAKRIGRTLVEEKLAACVQISTGMTSIYSWNDGIAVDEEVGLTVKTSVECQQRTVERVLELHPYDVPQVTVVPIIGGAEGYLNWIRTSTKA